MSDSEADVVAGYDLTEQPWLLALRTDGTVEELSLLEVFRHAGELTGLVGEVATQTFALTRLLLAVLHRAVDGPRDDDHWAELWADPQLPIAQIEKYLDWHRTRFDLFHPHAPFFQVAGLRTSKGEVSELSKLIADVPNGHPFFTTRLGPGNATLSPAEAARWVVHCQAFDPSGIKSGAVGDARVKGGKGYPIGVAWSGLLGGVLPEGATLKETLLLNLIATDYSVLERWRSTDAPVWERAPVGPGEEQVGGRPATGPVDLYTWQSRRIRLEHSDGRVTGVLVCNGERMTPQNKHRVEPHTAWRRSTPQEKKLGQALVYMPREHDPERAIWRGLQALLPGVSGRTQGKEGAVAISPIVLEWVDHLQNEMRLSPDFPLRVRTLGMIYGTNSSVIDEVIDDAMSIRAVLLQREATALAQVATGCAVAAEASARALGFLAANLAEATGGEFGGPKSRATELAFAELDAPFREWLSLLRRDSEHIQVQVEWHQQADRIVRRLGTGLLDAASPTAWAGRTVKGRLVTTSHADLWFREALRKALPMAHLPAADDATVSA
jgi:CRISPR system Cascade subunit CasA